MEKYLQIQVDASLKRKVKMRCAMSGDTAKTIITQLLEGWVNGEIVLETTVKEQDFE